MARKNGFTLLEVLIVLAMWSIFILLSAPLHFSSLNKQQEKQFLETLEFDVLYAQNLAIGSPNHTVAILFREDSYSIVMRDGEKKLLERKVPPDSMIDPRTHKQISFNEHGSIRKPGTIAFKTKNTSYNIIFPLGKARCYIAEQ